MSDFGSALKRYRVARKLSQHALGRLSGYDTSFVSRLEAGTREPTRETVKAIAGATGATRDERETLYLSAGYTHNGLPQAIHPQLRALNQTLQHTDLDEVTATRVQLLIEVIEDIIERVVTKAEAA